MPCEAGNSLQSKRRSNCCRATTLQPLPCSWCPALPSGCSYAARQGQQKAVASQKLQPVQLCCNPCSVAATRRQLLRKSCYAKVATQKGTKAVASQKRSKQGNLASQLPASCLAWCNVVATLAKQAVASKKRQGKAKLLFASCLFCFAIASCEAKGKEQAKKYCYFIILCKGAKVPAYGDL